MTTDLFIFTLYLKDITQIGHIQQKV